MDISFFLIIIYLMLISCSFSYMMSGLKKCFFHHKKTLVQLTTEENKRLEKCYEDILYCKKSWNPLDRFQIEYLTEEIHQLERRKESEEKKISEEKESEKKKIYLCKQDYETLNPPIKKINRKIFDKLTSEKDLIHVGDLLTSVEDFDDLIEGETYILSVGGLTNFEGFAKNEGDIQTKDCVASILNGNINITGFNISNCKVVYEYDIADSNVKNPIKELGFGFPVRPDALLVSEDQDTWVVLESKHTWTKDLMKKFIKKVEFIVSNKEMPWILNKDHNLLKNPKYIIPAMSSISQFDVKTNNMQDSSNQLVRLCRDDLDHSLILVKKYMKQ